MPRRDDGARFGGANSRAARLWKRRGRVVTVPGAGHDVMFDDPDAIVAAVAGRH